MTTLAASRPFESRRSGPASASTRIIMGALALVVLMQLSLVFAKTFNWDELWHYSLITAAKRGEDVQWLQTPFVPLYGWVTRLGLSTLEQMMVMRGFTLAFEIGLIAAIFIAARRIAAPLTALLCCLAYATAGYVFLHGFALRADVIAAALLAGALALALHGRITLANAAIGALLLALATVATIKSVLWAPAFLGAFVLRRQELQLRPRTLATAAIASLVGLAVAVLGAVLAFPNAAGEAFSLALASGERMFSAGLFPQGRYALRQAIIAPLFTVLLVVFCGWLAKGEASRREKIGMALLAAPLISVLFYRNAFPYYFTFILPPVAIALAPAIELAVRRYGAMAVAAALTLNAAALWIVEPRSPLDSQRQFQAELRGVFPQPVSYIDECGFLGDYPRAVLAFSSGWALDNYRNQGQPLYSQALERETVPLLIRNSLALHNVFAADKAGDRLLPEDEALLRSNFVHHGGIIHVAGKVLPARSAQQAEYVAVPGAYRVEGEGVSVDGNPVAAGSVIELERRDYAFTNSGTAPATLRWAAAGQPIASSVTLRSLFTDY
jgi:hypothetical protein